MFLAVVLKSFLSGLWAALLYLGFNCLLCAWRKPGKLVWLFSVAFAEVDPELSASAEPVTLAMPLSSPLAHTATAGLRKGFFLYDLSVANTDFLPMVFLVRHEQKALIIPLLKC